MKLCLFKLDSVQTTILYTQVSSLQQKVKTLEDGGQKLAQRQQQVASLRKQLKSKDDALSEQVVNIVFDLLWGFI